MESFLLRSTVSHPTPLTQPWTKARERMACKSRHDSIRMAPHRHEPLVMLPTLSFAPFIYVGPASDDDGLDTLIRDFLSHLSILLLSIRSYFSFYEPPY